MITCFESYNEQDLKEYIRVPSRRWEICNGEVWYLTGGIEEAWRFIKDKYVLAIHLFADPDLLLRSPDISGKLDIEAARDIIENADAILGLSFKKLSNASLGSLLKCYKMESLLNLNESSTSEDDEEMKTEKLEEDIIKKIVSEIKVDESLLKDLKRINTLSIRCELYVPEEKW